MLPLKPGRKEAARRPRSEKAVRHKPAAAKGSGPLVHASSGGPDPAGKRGGKRKKPDADGAKARGVPDADGEDAAPPKRGRRARKEPGEAAPAGDTPAHGRGRGRGRGRVRGRSSVHARGREAAASPSASAGGRAAGGPAAAAAAAAGPAGSDPVLVLSSSDDDGEWDGAGAEQAAKPGKRKAPAEAGKGKGKAAAAAPGTAKRFHGGEAAPGGGRRNRADLEFENQMLMAYQVGPPV